MKTIIGIPAMGSYNFPEGEWEVERDDEDLSDPAEIYEKPYQILFDGVAEALKLLRAKEYDKAKECLMNAQVEADEAVCGPEDKR